MRGRLGLAVWSIALLAAGLGLLAGSARDAGAGFAPIEMRFACANANGVLFYAQSAAACRRGGESVAFHPGPVHTCVRRDRRVREVDAPGDCTRRERRLALPRNTRTYFCAERSNGGLLRRIAQPSQCAPTRRGRSRRTIRQLLVFVVNHAPAALSLSGNSITENNAAGALVGTLAARDPDRGASFQFSPATGTGDTDNSSFHIAGDGLLMAASSDFETKRSYSLRIRATDQWGLWREEALTVTITDANDAPTEVALTNKYIPENQPAATTFGTFSTHDQDAGQPHSYQLVAGFGDEDNASFEIVGSSLRTAAVFNYESKNAYTIRVRSTDGGSPALSIDGVFIIAVTDLIENVNPVAVDDNATTSEDTQLTLPVSGAGGPAGNDTDPDSDPLTVTAVSNSSGGAASISGATIQFDPSANLCGSAAGGFDYTVSDGRGGTDVGHVSVDITCVGDPPAAVGDSATVPEDAAATAIDVLANDGDPDGGAKAIGSVTQPANGTVVVTGAGSGLTYQPNANYCNAPPGTSPDLFTYTLTPGGSTATVSVSVTCVDDPPTAVDDSATVGEDAAATAIDVLANDIDDGGATAIDSVTQPANGTVVITGGGAGLTYQPNAGFCSATPDTFTYTLNGGSTATVSVTVTCLDDPPTAVDDNATVGEDSGASPIDVLANDTDTDGGPKTINSAGDPANGTVVITGGGTGVTYQPDPNYCNDPPGTTPETFTYTLNGGSTATVSVRVTCVDDPPTAVDDNATVGEDSGASPIDVLTSDTDVDGGQKTISSASDPANGTVVLTGGSPGEHTGLTYQPDPNYCNDPPGTTPDTFTYTLNGGSTATVSITVTCVPEDPALDASPGSTSYTENDPATPIDSAVTVSDPDLEATITSSTVQITGGYAGSEDILALASPGSHPGITPSVSGDTLTLSGNASPAAYQAALRDVTYRNSSDSPSTAARTITFTVTDETSRTGSDTKGLTVSTVDDPPVAVNDSATVLEGAAATSVPVLANDTDVDGGSLTIASASDPANGAVVITGGGTGLTYQPDPNYCNDPPGTTPDTFTYTLNGGSTGTVSMTVTCVPSDPVVDNSAGSTSYTENDPATPIDPAVTVTDLDLGATNTAATVQITGGYAGAQDILALASPSSHPGITASFSGDTLTLSGNASPAAYQAALRDVTYRNSSDSPSTAARTVTFTVTDETTRSGSDTKGVTVVAIDDPPTAVNDSATLLEDASATSIPVLTNDTDVDGGQKTISSASDPANGTVVLTGGSPGAHTGLTYQPDPNYCNDPPGTTPDTFTYTVNGGSVATVSMTVTCVNDPPVADDETFSGNDSAHGNTAMIVNDPDDGAPNPSHPKTTVTGDILAGDTDVDGPGPLTVTPETKATNDGGSVTIESDGDFTFHPAASTSCTDTSDSFTYTVEDNGSPEQTDTGQVTIAIAGCVWYVSNNAAGNSGTSAAPFDTLAQAETASGNNHTVFVFDGDNTSTGLGGNGYAMNAGERLIGEHEGLQVDPDGGGGLTIDTLHPPNAGAHPTLTASNADVIDLDDGNELRGLNVDPQGTGGGIAGGAGDTGGGTIDDVNVIDTIGAAGTQAGLELSGTTGAFNVTNLSVNNNATGVLLTNAGTTDFGSTTITSNGAPGLSATGTNMSTSAFDTVNVTGSSSGGVSMSNTTGTTTFGDLSLTTTSGAAPAFSLATAGTVSVPAAGTANLSATGGPAVDVTGTSDATLAFDAVSSTNSANDGINLAGLGTGTFSAASGAIGNASGIAFDLDGGSGTISYPGALNNGSGTTAVEITGRNGGTVTLSGPIADTNDAGGGISLSGNTAGSTTFSNASKVLNTTTGTAVALTNNTGHTINVTGGGLDITTASGIGFTATGGGTVNVTGSANTVASTTGTSLNVANTTIGASGLTFQSISANGAPSGIVLNNTGSTAGLTVSGTANANSGGTIQNTTSHGITLTSTRAVSLNRMNIQSTAGSGVRGTTAVNGFSFTNGTINNSGTGGGNQDSSIAFNDPTGSATDAKVTGTVTITGNTLTNARWHGVSILQFAGTLDDVNISNNTLTSGTTTGTGGNSFGSGIQLFVGGVASSVASVTRAELNNNTITNFPGGVPMALQSGTSNATGPVGTFGTPTSATNDIEVQGNILNGGGTTPDGAGGVVKPNQLILATVNGRGVGNFNIQNNGTAADPISGSIGNAIDISAGGDVTAKAIVSGNRIDVAGQSVSGTSGIAAGVGSFDVTGPVTLGDSKLYATVTNNNIVNSAGSGIRLNVNNGSPDLFATVTGNTVGAPLSATYGIQVVQGPTGTKTTQLDIANNTSTGGTGGGNTFPGIGLRKQGTTLGEFAIVGLTPSPATNAQMESSVASRNTSTPGTFGTNGVAAVNGSSNNWTAIGAVATP